MPSEAETLLRAFRTKERPEHLLQNLEEMRREGQVPDDVYAPLKQEYLDGIESADNELDKLRQGLKRQLALAREELTGQRQELERVGNQYKYGSLTRAAYEKASRALEAGIASLHNRAEWLRALSDSTSAAEVEQLAGVSPQPVRTSARPAKSLASGPSRHRRLLPVAAGLAVIIAIAAGVWWALPAVKGLLPPSGQPSQQALEMVTGERVDVATQQVGAPGGAVSVNGTGTPLDGLSLELPQGAFEAPVTFDLGYSPIEELDAGDGVQAISPLIHVDSGTTEYADDLVALTVPVDVPDGHFAMAFVYDEDLGLLHPLPTLEETDGTLTALSRHFCPIVMLSAPFERFLSESIEQPGNLEAVKRDTGFLPGRDTWNLVNAGSCVAPGGYCHGMSLTSLFYYMVEGRITGQPLWKDEYANGLPEGMGTPGFWQDDRWAIELCSVVNRFGATSDVGRVMDGIAARVNGLTPERRLKTIESQFYMTAFALYVTRAPQLISVRESSGGGGHSLLCYGVDGTTLSVADPNYPDRKDITVPFQNGALGPYKSAQSTRDIQSGNYRTYDHVYYQGDISFYNLGKLDTLWTDYEAGSLKAGFPPYTIQATELDEQGTPLRTYELDREMSNRSATRRLRFELDSVLNRRLLVYEYCNPPSPVVPMNEVTLTEGDNYIGFLVEEKKGERWEWAGFDWVHIYMPHADEEVLSYLCNITVDFDCVPIQDGKRAEMPFPYSIEIQAYGKYAGGTFTADWHDVYDWGPVDTGHIAVSFDPDMVLVKSFDFWREYSDEDPSHYQRTGATGSGIELVEEFSDPGQGTYTYWGSSDGGMAPPHITWVEENFELADPENFVVTIGLAQLEPEDDGIPRG